MSCMSQNFRLFIEFIRSKLSNFSAHVYGVTDDQRGKQGKATGLNLNLSRAESKELARRQAISQGKSD